MDAIAAIALTLGAAWASGLNLYAAVLVLGLLANTGYAVLPPGLQVLQDPLVLGVAGLMYFVEFFADKVPGVDSGWDTLHTFIRIPAGAVIAASAASGMHVNEAVVVAAALLGGGVAGVSHFTKAGVRLVANASPEPFSNWALSTGEDVAVVGGLLLALHSPWLFLALLVAFVMFALWLLPKILRAIAAVFRRLRGWLGGKRAADPS